MDHFDINKAKFANCAFTSILLIIIDRLMLPYTIVEARSSLWHAYVHYESRPTVLHSHYLNVSIFPMME
jgi:hypothetical protein